MADHSNAPVLTKATIDTLIARLGGQLDAIKNSGASDADLEKATDTIVPLMQVLHSVSDRGDQELGDWVEDLGRQFENVADLLRSTLNVAASELGGCYYRRGDSNEVVCVMTTKAACEGIGEFDENGCS